MQYDYFSKIPLRSHLPRMANQYYVNRAPPNNKAYYKVPSNLSS